MSVITLNPSADAEYQNDNPNLNVGTSQNISTGEEDGTNTLYETVLKFDLNSPLNNNAIKVLATQLVLTMHDDKINSGVGTARLRLYRLTSAFAEGTVTYNTKPTYHTTQLGYVDVADNYRGDVTISLDAAVIQQLCRGTLTNYGFLLRSTHTDREFEANAADNVHCDFRSREYTTPGDRPELTITYRNPSARAVMFD